MLKLAIFATFFLFIKVFSEEPCLSPHLPVYCMYPPCRYTNTPICKNTYCDSCKATCYDRMDGPPIPCTYSRQNIRKKYSAIRVAKWTELRCPRRTKCVGRT